ncbi:MAG: protein kinase [Actinomycetia bacterium]|nr:protein kinase [Actinomycetes bacterium]
MGGIELGIDGVDDATVIGVGGFSTVYAATDIRFSRRVAVKVLGRSLGEAERRRFDRECAVMGRLSGHPNVVTVYSGGYTSEGRAFLVMELVEGGTLADRLAHEGRLPWREAVALVSPIAEALAEAHRVGILHRDVKPENILLHDDRPLLTDFGIAYLRDATGSASTQITASWLHTPPETFSNKRDERSDLYSLASTLHCLISGQPPFWRPDDESLNPLMLRLLNEPAPRLEPDLASRELSDVVLLGLAKDPADRPQTVIELKEAINAAASAESSSLTAPPAASDTPVTVGSEAGVGEPPASLVGRPGDGSVSAPDSVAPDAPVGEAVDDDAMEGIGLSDQTVVAGSVGLATVPADNTGMGPLVPRSPSITGPGADPNGRSAWRLAGGAALVVVVLLVLFGGIGWFGSRGWFVDATGDNTVGIFRGRPGGFLWVDPSEETDSGISVDDLAADEQAAIHERLTFSSLEEAEGFVASLGAEGGSVEGVFRGHESTVTALIQLHDSRVVSGSDDATVHVWHPDDPTTALVFHGHTGWVRAVAELEDGRVASASEDGTVQVWDPNDPDLPAIGFDGHYAPVAAVISLQDGRVASGGEDGVVRIWNPHDPAEEFPVFEAHTSVVRALTELDDRRIASGSVDGTVRIWHPDEPMVEQRVLDHSATVTALGVLSDGRLAVATSDGLVFLWDVFDVDAEPLVFHHPDAVSALVSLDDGRFATGSDDDEVRIWEPDNPDAPVLEYGEHQDSVRALAVLDDGSIASGSVDGTVRIWHPDGI